MRRSLNLHSNFFSSLKQVEKRLKLEDKSSHSPRKTDNSEPLSSPIYLHNNIISDKSSNLDEDSETPHEFLSNSLDFPPTHEEESLPEKTLLNSHEKVEEKFDVEVDDDDDVDEIGLLIELLGLSDYEGCDSNLGLESCCSCECGEGFFGKIVGVKGPKCKKELERLEGWISHFRKEDIEPLRLAHLLLGKAAFLYGSGGGGEGFEGLEFPSTVEEFLRRDPPAA